MTIEDESRVKVSVVIPAYRRPDLLRDAVKSVLVQDLEAGEYEVIVVDSSPDSENQDVVTELQREVGDRTLRFYRKAPEGPGPSRTLGAEHAAGEFIAFLDSDCEAAPDWLRNGLVGFTDDVGIVQGRTLPDPNAKRGIFCRYVQIESENPRYEAANIFFRRECVLSAGQASADMTPNAERPMGGEDSIMAWRVKRSGWASAFADAAVVYHAILPIGVWDWLCDKRMYMLPWLLREVPEMRQVFFLGVFLDKAHAGLLLALLGIVFMLLGMVFLGALLCVPYVVVRVSEPSMSLKGPMRFLRALVYLPRDILTFSLLALGSVRFRSLVL